MSGKRMLVSHIWPGFGSDWPWLVLKPTQHLGHLLLPHMQKHLQKRAVLGETWKLCLIKWVLLTLEMVTLTFTSKYWQTPSHSQVNTFLPINIIHFGLLIASNFYSQRIPAWLGFIPQNYVKHEWSAILALQKRNCTPETKPRFYTWVWHLTLYWIPAGIRCFHISETWVKGLKSHKLLGTAWNNSKLF